MHKLLPSYDRERRLHASDIVDVSGTYLRYSCNRWDQPVPKLHRHGEEFGEETIERSIRGRVSGIELPPGHKLPEHLFLADFYMRYGAFLLGMDIAYGTSMLNVEQKGPESRWPVSVENGVRCPSPRVCFSEGEAGYLYDKMKGSALFHILVFASDILGPVKEGLKLFSASLSNGFYKRYGGNETFNIVFVTKCLPFEVAERMADPELSLLGDTATMVYDDRPPDEDAHYTWGVDHAKGAIVVVRPDLWVGMSAFPGETVRLDHYFGNFLVPQSEIKMADVASESVAGDGKKAGTHLDEPTHDHRSNFTEEDLESDRSTDHNNSTRLTNGDMKGDGYLANGPLPDYTVNGSIDGKRGEEIAMTGGQASLARQGKPMDGFKSNMMEGAHDGLSVGEAKGGVLIDEPAVSTKNAKGEYFLAESAGVDATH